MKLVFFGDAIVEHLRRWTTFFARQGHEVHVITWNLKVLDGYGDVHVHPMPKALSSSNALARAVNLVSLTRRVRRLLRQIQPDLIHAHSAGPYAWMGMVTRFRPFLITPWGSDVLIHVHDSLINHYFTVRALRHADCVQAEGEDTREALLQLGVDNRNIIVLPIGVDTARYRPGKPSADFLAAHGLAGGPVVVSTRTPTPVHDVDSTIHAAAIVLQKAPAVKFLIVGGGSELPRLKDLGNSLGIGGALVFTDHVDEDEMAACLQAADVCVSTSLSDSGTAASIAEAMACGLPVVATDAGNVRERIHDGENGYVVPLRSPTAVAEKILHLLANPEERRLAGQRNRQLVEEQLDVRHVMKTVESLYVDLCEKATARRK